MKLVKITKMDVDDVDRWLKDLKSIGRDLNFVDVPRQITREQKVNGEK